MVVPCKGPFDQPPGVGVDCDTCHFNQILQVDKWNIQTVKDIQSRRLDKLGIVSGLNLPHAIHYWRGCLFVCLFVLSVCLFVCLLLGLCVCLILSLAGCL